MEHKSDPPQSLAEANAVLAMAQAAGANAVRGAGESMVHDVG